MKKEKIIVTLKAVDKEKGFCIGERIIKKVASKLNVDLTIRTPQKIPFSKNTIAHIISSFLEIYEDKPKRK